MKRGYVGPSMVLGSWDGAGGIFVFLNTFVFFRSLALVFQNSPTRNKEATRFTLYLITVRVAYFVAYTLD